MGALPQNDEPEGIDRRDIIFYTVMALILAFAIQVNTFKESRATGFFIIFDTEVALPRCSNRHIKMWPDTTAV